MFNTFKVHPQDTVKREGSFAQFTVEEQQPPMSFSSPQNPHLTVPGPGVSTRRRAISEPLPIMEPRLDKMESRTPQYQSGPAQPHLLNPMHATLPPMQPSFPIQSQMQVHADRSPSLTPPRSPYGAHTVPVAYYPIQMVTPVSPLRYY